MPIKSAPNPKKRRKPVKPIPDNYPAVNVVLRIKGAAAAIDYYAHVFDAKPRMRLDMPDGRVGHAELKFDKGLVMLSDEYPENNILGPKTIGGSPVAIQVYVKNVDAVMARAVKAGGKMIRPATDEFYGDRSGMIEDPFGHLWMVQTHIEDVTPAQMKKRLAQMVTTAQGKSD